MLRDWCLAVSQEKTAERSNNSFVGITFNAVIHTDDDLTKWIDRCLDMTMGRRVAPTNPPQKATSDSGTAAHLALPPPPLWQIQGEILLPKLVGE